MHGQFLLLPWFIAIPVLNSDSVDPDQTPQNAASDLAPHCLPIPTIWDATRHRWVKNLLDCYLYFCQTSLWPVWLHSTFKSDYLQQYWYFTDLYVCVRQFKDYCLTGLHVLSDCISTSVWLASVYMSDFISTTFWLACTCVSGGVRITVWLDCIYNLTV